MQATNQKVHDQKQIFHQVIQEANLIWRYYDESNLVMPWYTMPCLEWLKTQGTKEWEVFEYGVGQGAGWWRLNSADYEAVESDRQWAKAMSVTYQPDKVPYIQSINRFGRKLKGDAEYRFDTFDCVIVDGLYRFECVEFCRQFIKPGGILLIDNYENESGEVEDWGRLNKLLEGWGKQVFKQPNHTDWNSAVFQKPKE